jgi:hypothetical protein
MTGDAISYFDERPLFLFLVALRRLYIGRLARRQAPAARWAGPRVFSGVARFPPGLTTGFLRNFTRNVIREVVIDRV